MELRRTDTPKSTGGSRKPILATTFLLLILTCSINVFATEIDTTLRFGFAACTGCPDYGARRSSSVSSEHTGLDYYSLDALDEDYEDWNSSIKSMSYGKIAYKWVMREETNADLLCMKVNGCGKDDHGMGNILEITYLLRDGTEITSSYNHLKSFANNTNRDSFVSTEQVVGIIGASGQENREYWTDVITNRRPHSHVEFKTIPRDHEADEVESPWGYSLASSTPDDFNFRNPSDYIDQRSILFTSLSSKSSNPSPANFSVYARVGETITGELNAHNAIFDKAGILVRASQFRTDTENTAVTATHKWLAEGSGNLDGLNGFYSAYDEGQYLFVPFARLVSQDASYGYPVRYDVIGIRDVIVDNEQINSGDYQYNVFLGTSTPRNKIPGYFLNADIFYGASDVSANWKPNIEGDYRISVHIPENGATATEVIYKLVTSSGNIVSSPVNQTTNLGEWVELTFDTQDTLALKRSDYIGITLASTGSNAATGANSKVAFDAIKFEHVTFQQVPSTPEAPIASNSEFSDHISITWQHQNSASYYELERCNATGFALCSSIGTSLAASFDDYDLGTSTAYRYGIKACNNLGCSTRSELDLGSIENSCSPQIQQKRYTSLANHSLSASACVTPPRVLGVQATDGTFTNKIEVTWNHVSSITSYLVYRCKDVLSSSCDYYGLATSNEFEDNAAELGSTYFYQIKACIDSLCSTELSDPDSGFRASPSSIDSMSLISETIPDGFNVSENQAFTKTWTVLNVGTSTWDSSYCLKYSNGISMGLSTESCVIGEVKPNQTYTFSVPMVAPSATSENSLYRDNWKLHKGSAIVSGNIWVEILVEGVTPTSNTPSLSASAINASTIHLSWNADSSGIDYRLFRSNSISGPFELLRQLSALEFNDDNLSPSTTYHYKLQRCVNGNQESCSNFSSVKSVTTPAAATVNSLISSFISSSTSPLLGSTVNLNAVLHNGGGIANNNRFQFVFALSDNSDLDNSDTLILAVPESGNFVLLPGNSESYSKTYRIPDDAPTGTTNFLACALYRDQSNDTQQHCSPLAVTFNSEPVSAPNVPSKPVLTYQQGNDELSIAWNASSGGNYYRLERSTNPSGGFSEIFSGNAFSFIDETINDGTTYYYRLRSCQNSLANTCSGYSSNSNVTTTSTAVNDFFAGNIKISRQGPDITIEAKQRYSGTSTSLVYPKMGFYLSTDTVCSTSTDIFLGEQSSGLNVNDISDTEDITVTYPSQANTGTWYACAIADYDNAYSESNENNNSVYLTARTEVPAPSLYPEERGYMRAEWSPVAGNVSYRLSRALSEDGPFDSYIYIGTGTSFFESNLSYCTEYFYRLQSCNGIGANALCSNSPVVSGHTLPNVTPPPSLEVVSPTKIKVSWENLSCASHFVVERERESGSDSYVYAGTDTSFVDNDVHANSTSKYRLLACPTDTSDLGNLCASFSEYVSANTPLDKNDTDIWQYFGTPSGPENRSNFSQLVFKNKIWTIAGELNSIRQNDVWSSDDGENWELVTLGAEFPKRSNAYIASHLDRMFLIGGEDLDGNFLSDVWSSEDGMSWRLETADAGFPKRSGGATLFSFLGKLWLIGGNGRNPDGSYAGALSDIWSSTDGTNWQQHASLPFGQRSNHQVLQVGETLYLYGGEGIPAGETDHVASNDIWSSSNAIDWQLVKKDLPYGSRERHKILEYAGFYWLIGGRHEVTYSYLRDYDVGRMVPRFFFTRQDDVWKSEDGLTWNKVYETSEWTHNTSLDPINFNNRVWQVRTTPNERWAANFGYSPTTPNGSISILGAVVKGGELVGGLTGINYTFAPSGLTYQWFKNGEKVAGETQPSIDLNNFSIGDTVHLIVRYTNENKELWQFESETKTIGTNPISSEFELSTISLDINSMGAVNPISNWDEQFDIEVSIDDPAVASVSANGSAVSIAPLSTGSATVITKITDATSGATKSISFDVDIAKGEQELQFPIAVLSKADNSSDFSVSLSQTGSTAASITYSSSNMSVATVSGSGSSVNVQIHGVGSTTISGSKASDNNYLAATTSFVLTVYEGDTDGDGINDESDNCVNEANPNQENADGDAFGDACDPDDDGDFVVDTGDCAPLDIQRWFNRTGYEDVDLDGIGFGLSVSICSGQTVASPYVESNNDNCPSVSNSAQSNYDNDSQGDACDPDDDNDLFDDILDCASLDETKWQLLAGYLDVDLDGFGYGLVDQVCSGEILPSDYATQTDDNCQFDSNPDQLNSDDDLDGDACDPDDDNDLVLDGDDNCPVHANPEQLDKNINGIGDACETNDTNEICIPVKTKNGALALICL